MLSRTAADGRSRSVEENDPSGLSTDPKASRREPPIAERVPPPSLRLSDARTPGRGLRGGWSATRPTSRRCFDKLRRPHPQGCPARRPAGPIADESRAGHQPQDRQGALALFERGALSFCASADRDRKLRRSRRTRRRCCAHRCSGRGWRQGPGALTRQPCSGFSESATMNTMILVRLSDERRDDATNSHLALPIAERPFQPSLQFIMLQKSCCSAP
jgi:hypothetical protein